MAALSDLRAGASGHSAPRIVDLRLVRAEQLAPVLEEEADAWRRELDWDFAGSAALVRRFLDMQALSGFCLVGGGGPVGYAYVVSENNKGLIGDFFIAREYSTLENERILLGAVVDALTRSPAVRRIESQLMMLRWLRRDTLPHSEYAHVVPRCFMRLDLTTLGSLPPRRDIRNVTFDSWSERRQDEAAALIPVAYRGHVDSDINDQYRSPAGARRFLANIIQYPGCGTFFHPASFMALDNGNGRLCGMCLSSLVAFDVGHITQVCVVPAFKGKGCGYELMRRSLDALINAGCRAASLTVTAANTEAIVLYERLGFRTVKTFSACVWEGF
ncbi:MAG: GNAT family N-acetyltransferase [Bryobacteraceae bacterium]|jgi:ribosomal protein S18 acetylase RimI-like enzyme